MMGRFPLELVGAYLPTQQACTYPFGIDYDSVRDLILIAEQPTSPRILRLLNRSTLAQINSVTFIERIGVVAYDSLNDRYIVCFESGTAKRFCTINPTTLAVTNNSETIGVNGPVARDIKIDYTNDRFYISGSDGAVTLVRTIYVYKLSDLTPVTSFAVTNSGSIQPDPINNVLFVLSSQDKKLHKYDLSTYSFISTINLTTTVLPYHLQQDDVDNNIMLILDINGNKINVFDKTTNTIKGAIAINKPAKSCIVGDSIYFTAPDNTPKICILKKFY